MVYTPQRQFACTRNKHQSNDDRTPRTGIGGAGGGCRRRRSFRHVLLSIQNHAMGVFSLQDGDPCHCFPEQEWKWPWMSNSCVMSMSLFSGTRTEKVSLFKVNSRLRRAQKKRFSCFWCQITHSRLKPVSSVFVAYSRGRVDLPKKKFH